jgi:hypothetical protein
MNKVCDAISDAIDEILERRTPVDLPSFSDTPSRGRHYAHLKRVKGKY